LQNVSSDHGETAEAVAHLMPPEAVTSEVHLLRESYGEIISDIQRLLPEHWKELALYREDIPLDPDFSLYARADQIGMCAIFGLRTNNHDLVGYAIYFVRPHHHYKAHKWAISDIYWLHPDYRTLGIGKRMFAEVEEHLRRMGVSVMHTTLKSEHPEASFVLQALGHHQVEIGYSKKLI